MSKAREPQKSYLSPGEVAELFMVTTATVRNWASKGLLKSVSTQGGHRRFMRRDVERFAHERNLAIPRANSGALRILIVDDDMHVATFLSRFFANVDTDIDTLEAYDGYTAGKYVQTFRPHIVLLDLMMPGLDGFEVCKQIKNDPNSKMTRVIAMTGHYSTENVERALQAGAECCIEKPFDSNKLLQLIEFEGSSTPSITS